MATVSPARMPTLNTALNLIAWSTLAQSDSGAPIGDGQYSDRSVQVVGVFGGASVRIEGSLNGIDWALLTDPQGNDLTITGPKIEAITEVTTFLRPVIAGGDGTTSLTVTVLCVESR